MIRRVVTSPCTPRQAGSFTLACHRRLSQRCRTLCSLPPSHGSRSVLLSRPEGVELAEAIIVLAGGLTDDGGVPRWVERRLDGAAELLKLTGNKSKVLLTGGGTPHKPSVIDPKGYVIHESTSCARYLLAKGLNPSLLLKELASHDTVGNAYFSLTSHVIPGGWKRLAVVTSEFHMPRSQQLFADMCELVARDLYDQPGRFELHFCPVSDEGIFSPEVLQLRKDKEAKSLQHWQSTRQRLTRLSDLHGWLHDEHMCYAVGRQEEWGLNTIKDPVLLKSY